MDTDKETSLLLERPPVTPGKTYRLTRLVTLLMLWICFGGFSEIVGPVLPELAVQTHSDYGLLAQAVSMRGAGHAVGGIIGGLTIDRWFNFVDISASFWLVVYTAIGVGSAYVQSLPLLYVVFLAQGSVETLLQTIGCRIALRLWREKAAGPLFALHMGYGVGSIVVPQIVASYLDPRFSGKLADEYNSSCESSTSHSSTTTPSYNLTSTTQAIPNYPANFVSVYYMLSSLSISISLIFLMYHFYGRLTGVRIVLNDAKTENKRTFRESLSFKTCSQIHPKYAGGIVIVLSFYYCISVPQVRAFSKFVYSYGRDGPCLSVRVATALESAYFASLTVGRLCAFLVSPLIHMKILLQTQVISVLIITIVLYVWHTSTTVLWIFVSALGFFTGPIIPSAFAWANCYIEVTSMAQILPQIGAAIGDLGILSGVGYSYQYFGPYTLWSYQLGLAVGMVVIGIILQTLGSLHGDRHRS